MELSKIIKTGDLLFDNGNSFVSKMIKKLTWGKTNHVGIIYDENTIFETDLSWGKAEKHPITKYINRNILILRLKELEDYGKIKELCDKYVGTPYSFWDIFTNALFSPLKDEIREKLVEVCGTKKFAICSELSARIIYETTGYRGLAEYEGLTPQDLLKITIFHPQEWEVVYQSSRF